MFSKSTSQRELKTKMCLKRLSSSWAATSLARARKEARVVAKRKKRRSDRFHERKRNKQILKNSGWQKGG